LIHLSVNGGNSEFFLFKLLGQLVYFLGSIAINDGLVDFEVHVEVH
jgi:hypothetical protein